MKHFTIDNETTSPSTPPVRPLKMLATWSSRWRNNSPTWSARITSGWSKFGNSLPGVKAVAKFTNRKVATERIWKAIQGLGGVATPEPSSTPAPVSNPEPGPTPEGVMLTGGPPEIVVKQAAPTIESPEPLDISERATENPIAASAEPKTTESATPPISEAANADVQAPDVAPVETKPSKKAMRAQKAHTGEPKAAREGSKTDQAIAMMKRPGGATLPELMATFGWQAHTVRGFVAGALTKKLGLTIASTKPEGGERTYSIAS